MSSPADDIQLLQCSVDAEDDSYFRLLVNGTSIKYLTIAAGIYEEHEMCFGPTLISLLPPLPPGDWNDATIAKHPDSGTAYFKFVVKTRFPGVQSTWHPTSLEYLDLNLGTKLRTNVYEATLPGSNEVVIAKFARFAWEINYIDQECAAYRWIEGEGIGPKFLGNITEQGRVIGFIIERIADARHASSADYEGCRTVLARLHGLGIVHGDINKHNFLVVGDKATLIDFDSARKTSDERVLVEEMESLREWLASASTKGGISTTS